MAKCPVCGEHIWHGSNIDVDADWQEAVKRLKDGDAEDKPGQRGEVRFIYETGPDGVERIFIAMQELVRARLASSHQALRTAPGPNGLPVLEVNGLQVELQGYDLARRRWWVELLDNPTSPDTPVSM
jgi:hypothetical protein